MNMAKKDHWALVPVIEKSRMPGLYKMHWEQITKWYMDCQNMFEEELPGLAPLAPSELAMKLGTNTIEARTFGLEGKIMGFELPPITPGGKPVLALYSVVFRRLDKCKHCGCYHTAADQCPPAWKVGQP
jgi:hypothetical protein